LRKKINTRELLRNFPSHPNSSNGNETRNKLSRRQRAILYQLVSILSGDGHGTLVKDIETFLAEDANRNEDLPSTRYKYIMAKEVIRAIENGRVLHLGLLLKGRYKKSPYRAIFVRGTCEDDTPEVSYVFTVWNDGRPAEDTRALRDIEKYVSIEVDLDGTTAEGLRRLRTKMWINGLCFFDGFLRKKAVFPWPASLHLNSRSHIFECDDCDRSFGSQSALNQHLNSPAHNFECDECDRSFRSQQSLEQHLNSPAHNFECDECDRSFRSRQSLEQHLDSPRHGFGMRFFS
jgi:uncharacterized C2H2 Zn-finger protein